MKTATRAWKLPMGHLRVAGLLYSGMKDGEQIVLVPDELRDRVKEKLGSGD